MTCSLKGGKRKRSFFRHTKSFLTGVGSDLRRKRLFPRTRHYVRSVSRDVNRYGNKMFSRARSMRKRTFGFR